MRYILHCIINIPYILAFTFLISIYTDSIIQLIDNPKTFSIYEKICLITVFIIIIVLFLFNIPVGN